MAGQITGAEAVLQALKDNEPITMVLVDREKDTDVIRTICESKGIRLEEGSANDLWRMSAQGHVDALALVGRVPEASLEEVFERGGTIWFFDGVTYSTNLGFAIRTAEVAGADAVLLNVAKTHEERRTIRRSSMRADRFIPVGYTTTDDILAASKKHGTRIIAVEDVGTHGPWEEDLTGDVVLVVIPAAPLLALAPRHPSAQPTLARACLETPSSIPALLGIVHHAAPIAHGA